MAKKPTPAKAVGDAIPEFRMIKDRQVPVFEPGPNGEVTAEEQAWADEEQRQIMAVKKVERDEAEKAEKADVAAKQERAAKRKQEQVDRLAKIEARLDAIEKAGS